MSNPVMRIEEEHAEQERVLNANDIMTVNGALQITAFMGLILMIAASVVWTKYTAGHTDIAMMLTSIGGIVGFVSALIIIFARITVLVPLYAACEGLFLGGISAMMEVAYPGIVSQAVAATFAALFSMLILYRLGIIRCTDKFRSVIFISTASIAAIYIVDFIGRLFNFAVPIINTATTGGILFSLVVVVIAALNLIIDFNFIEQGAKRMYPKKYEWYGAFGLMVTLVWLYIEILNLLAKFNNRD